MTAAATMTASPLSDLPLSLFLSPSLNSTTTTASPMASTRTTSCPLPVGPHCGSAWLPWAWRSSAPSRPR